MILLSRLYVEIRVQRIHVRVALFWDVTQRGLAVAYVSGQPFGLTSKDQAKED